MREADEGNSCSLTRRWSLHSESGTGCRSLDWGRAQGPSYRLYTHTEYIEQTNVWDSDPAEPLPPSSSPHLSSWQPLTMTSLWWHQLEPKPKYSITILVENLNLNVRVLTFHICQFVEQDVNQVMPGDKKTVSVFCGLSHVPLRDVLVCMCGF